MSIYDHIDVDFLVKAILSLENEAECKAFLEDILTVKEMTDMEQRLEVAKLLAENCRYTEISDAVGASTATISRVNRCLLHGSGGYKMILERLGTGEVNAGNIE